MGTVPTSPSYRLQTCVENGAGVGYDVATGAGLSHDQVQAILQACLQPIVDGGLKTSVDGVTGTARLGDYFTVINANLQVHVTYEESVRMLGRETAAKTQATHRLR